jgi:glycosyltransferase involved in cell wall biosynthesis
MIVKNEADVLARCLDSVKDAVDEIIIVDTGSTDETKNIALRYTDKLYDFEWVDDFAAARNRSYEKSTMDYQMWLDADDIISPESLSAMLELKKTLDISIEMVTMKYITHWDANGYPLLCSTRERLTRRDLNKQWQGAVHECIPLGGNYLETDIAVWHKKLHCGDLKRNINIYLKMLENKKSFLPRDQYYFARELKENGRYVESAMWFAKFLDDGQGWVEDNIASCLSLALCYKNMGRNDKILPALTRSFLYDAPRPEICTRIGYYYKEKKNFECALKWFLTALGASNRSSKGFVLLDYCGYIPCIEACVCSGELGDLGSAKIYNEKAAEYRPESPAVINNRKYLEARGV